MSAFPSPTAGSGDEGYRDAKGHTKPTATSLERCKAKVRDCWNARRAQPLPERMAAWQHYVRGGWNYFRISDDDGDIRRTEGWIRRHRCKFFWQRWHNRRGRANALRRLGAKGRQQQLASSSVGAWRLARCPTLHTVLKNARLRRWGLYFHRIWRQLEAAGFNRRMRKTACPVVWEG